MAIGPAVRLLSSLNPTIRNITFIPLYFFISSIKELVILLYFIITLI